jgi:hypothetical protein
MKWIYILIVLLIAAFTLGCVDKNRSGTAIETSNEMPAPTPASPGESAAIPSEMTQTPAPGDDYFGTYSDLAAIDNISSDLDMQITLSTEI